MTAQQIRIPESWTRVRVDSRDFTVSVDRSKAAKRRNSDGSSHFGTEIAAENADISRGSKYYIHHVTEERSAERSSLDGSRG